ncbi:hypothetical protein A3765_05780 [Oleiphilus sp. HI0130]|nr:hypothetical protein A3765_05780 [Oleiphilus sp. HI0130]
MLDEIYLRLLLELAPEELKLSPLDAERVILGYGQTLESKNAFGNLIRDIYGADPSSDIGLHYGRLLQPHALCDFSRVLMTASSFKRSLQIINELHYMQGAAYHLTFHESKDRLSIALSYPYKREISQEQRRFCCESIFTYLLNLARSEVSPCITPTRLWLDYEKPVYADEYRDLYGCEPGYDAQLALLEFSTEFSDQALVSGNHTLHNTYMKKCQDSARLAERYWSFDYRTTTHLMRNIPAAFNSEHLSQELSISPRGLQKKLNILNTSFSALCTQARAELVKVFLVQQGKSIEATAELMGFQTTSGFRRFFKTEFGMSVGTFLSQIRERESQQEQSSIPVSASSSSTKRSTHSKAKQTEAC